MGIHLDNSLILNAIKLHYNFKNDAEFARFLEIKPNTLSNWYARNSVDYHKIITKCVEIDANWLLTGKGEMLKEKSNATAEPLIPNTDSCKEIKALAEDRAYIIELQKKEIRRLETELTALQRTLQAKKTH